MRMTKQDALGRLQRLIDRAAPASGDRLPTERRMAETLIAEARQLGLPQVMAFTYVTGFFTGLGFEIVEHSRLPHKVFNDAPVGTAGMAINMNKPGLDDVRVRKALNHLNNRKMKIEKLYYNEYLPLTSYWQGGVYQNPDNELVEFDLGAAVELLAEAGWTEIDDEGYRNKNGHRQRHSIVKITDIKV